MDLVLDNKDAKGVNVARQLSFAPHLTQQHVSGQYPILLLLNASSRPVTRRRPNQSRSIAQSSLIECSPS